MNSRSKKHLHHSTFHAFFLAAKEKGYAEFQLELIEPKGRLEFCIRPTGHLEMSARFEVRGNMVHSAAKETGVIPTADTADARDINYGGTRSGEAAVWAL